MPQALIVVLSAIGAAIAAKFIAREWRRVNEELERSRAAAPVDAREGIPVLQRDPKTGVYRPMR